MTIVSERRVADEQKKQVEADSERIGLEAKECKAISDDAEADLGDPPACPVTDIPPIRYVFQRKCASYHTSPDFTHFLLTLSFTTFTTPYVLQLSRCLH